MPQILSADPHLRGHRDRADLPGQKAFVWPASAMLTGSGVALILRVPGTPPGDHWTTYKWYVFAGVAAFSLLTKYAIRYRGSHVFNPSNIGLVVAFLLLGSTRVEPLDFWWAPWTRWMILAYAVILVGGLLITARLQLLATAAVFWVGLAAGIGVLAASGHCMTARWAFAPVCGFDYWRVIVTSPEVLIFLFFMLTDPKTVPAGRVGRVVFASSWRSPAPCSWRHRARNSEPRSLCSVAWCSSARLVPSSIGWCPSRGRRPMTFSGSRPGWRSRPGRAAEWSAAPSGSR